VTASVINIKQGTSFSVTCVYSVNGTPTAVDDITIASQVRQQDGDLVATLSPVKTSEIGEFTIFAATESWPIGRLIWDIKYTTLSNKTVTETVEIRVARSATA
jgi:hypothetical protein